jgi:hypothetical protein
MGTFIRFNCELEKTDSLFVRKCENQLSVNFCEIDEIEKEILLSKDDCELLIIELQQIYKKLKNG